MRLKATARKAGENQVRVVLWKSTAHFRKEQGYPDVTESE